MHFNWFINFRAIGMETEETIKFNASYAIVKNKPANYKAAFKKIDKEIEYAVKTVFDTDMELVKIFFDQPK